MKKPNTPINIGKGELRRIEVIRAKIAGMDLVCPGTLLERRKTCGKPNCRCAKDPNALHGPYHEWTRLEEGRLVHKTVSSEQARVLEKAIGNHHEIKELLSRWKTETVGIILGLRKRKT